MHVAQSLITARHMTARNDLRASGAQAVTPPALRSLRLRRSGRYATIAKLHLKRFRKNCALGMSDPMMMRWWCIDDSLMMHWWCSDDALMMLWWRSDDVLLMRWRCTDHALMTRWWCADDALIMHWGCSYDTVDALMRCWWCAANVLLMCC